MTKTMIMRDRTIKLTDVEHAAARKALTQLIHGIDDQHHKRWIKVVQSWFGLEDGEITVVDTRKPRSGPFHRYHMATEQAVFNAQEKFSQFEQFRNWLKVGAGHIDWVAGPKGGVIPLPKSIGYDELEEHDMREFHQKMLEFFRGPHAAPYLWRHLGKDGAADMMESILAEFER